MAEDLAYKRKSRLRGKNRNVRFEAVYDMDNLRAAEKEARRGKCSPKKFHRGVKLFDRDPEGFLQQIHDDLESQQYSTSEGNECDQMCPCGKIRHLLKLPYNPDHIVHHAQMLITYPIMMRYYYYDSYASIKGKGMHFAARRVERYIDENKGAGRLYWIKRDFVKFYHNIDQEKAYDCVCKLFGNKGIRYLFHEIVTCCDEGLGIGLFPIQPLANLYTCHICRLIMSQCDVRVFVYCDDFLIIGKDKKEVWKASNMLEEYANEVMMQSLHDNVGMQIIDEHHFCDFVGYRFFFNHVLLRDSMKRKFMRKMHNLKDPMRRYRVAASYKGWLMHCNGFTLWCNIMDMRSFKELDIPKIEKKDADGKRMLEGTRSTMDSLQGREITFLDVEFDVRSKYDGKKNEPRYSAVVQVEDFGRKKKFFTNNPKLQETLRYCKEKDLFPFTGSLVQINSSGLPDYEIQ